MASAFWRSLAKFDKEKVQPALGLRNCLGVAIPIAVGVAIHQPAAGLIVSTGALNVCFSDGPEPYRQRGRRMSIASVLVACAIFAGGLSGRNDIAAVLLAGTWAFAAGMLVALGTEAADLGTISLVTLVVFAAQSLSPRAAAISGLLAFAGGLLQTALALALWPVRRYVPERLELGNLYRELARAADSHIDASEAPPATAEILKAQKALVTLARDHTIEGERYRLLLAQAERMRLRIVALARLRARMRREPEGAPLGETVTAALACAARLMRIVGEELLSNRPPGERPACLGDIDKVSAQLHWGFPGALAALVYDARAQVDALAGQLRSAADLATSATAAGLDAFEDREANRRWHLRLGGSVATLRANLTFESAACRHAIRLAGAVALGDALGRMVTLQRPYWIPMTIAIVLKPDFTTTFSRGVLRLAGTFAGLAIATALFHLFSPPLAVQVALIAFWVFILRWIGGANYGIFVAAVSALVVMLIALTGIAPQQVILTRALNTAAGGTLALLAYIVWPTWERSHVGETVALMLDGYRAYLREVVLSYTDGGPTEELDASRQGARLARSNAEASADRMAGEPGSAPDAVASLNAMLASSHRLVHAVMALEAGMASGLPESAGAAFRALAHQAELTLYLLAQALRGSALTAAELPNLRAAHQMLLQSSGDAPDRYALINIETDRIVNSLNTLSEQILKWVGAV